MLRSRAAGLAAALSAVLMFAGACATGGPGSGGAQTGAARDAPTGAAASLPPEVLAHVREADTLGRALYDLDKASAIGTDVMLENIPKPSGIGGWLTVSSADEKGYPTAGHTVLFMTREEPPRIACRVLVNPGAKPTFTLNDPPAPASEGTLVLFRARQAALAAVPRNGQPLNTVVLPSQTPGDKRLLVYILAGTTRPGELVFGIHYRVLVADHGTRVVSVTPLSKTALVIRDADLPPGAKPEAAFVTHIVTDWPLETHVLVSLMHRNRRILVGTRLGDWLVIGDKIDFIGPPQR